MNSIAGLWIDGRKGVIVEIDDGAERMVTVRSDVAPRSGRCGLRAADARDDETRPRSIGCHDRVLGQIADAEPILILGPDDADDESRRCIEGAIE
jgi:hypothetical protein